MISMEPVVEKIIKSQQPVVREAMNLAYATTRYNPYDRRGNFMKGSLLCYILKYENIIEEERLEIAKIAWDALNKAKEPLTAVIGTPQEKRLPKEPKERECFELLSEILNL